MPDIANRKLAIVPAIVIIVLVIIDLLATRQILYFDNTGQTIVFVFTVVLAYGICSWVLLGYTGQISKELRVNLVLSI